MDKNRSLSAKSLLLLVMLSLFVAGCGSTGGIRGLDRSPERRAEVLAMEGRHDDAAGIYIGLASEAAGSERQRLTLLAVEQWLDAGDGRRARSAMSEIEAPTDVRLRQLWDSNRAAILLWRGKPDEALDILRPLSSQSLTAERRIRVDALRGDAWFQKDDPVRAVNLYLQLEQALIAEEDIDNARQRLWAGLLVSDLETLRASSDFTSSAIIRGWLELGTLAVATGQQGIGWANGTERWQEAYPEHPAAGLLENFAPADPGMFRYPRQVALLLPMTGQSRALGEAIQSGFLAAYFRASGTQDEQQQIRVYDVGNDPNGAYERAVQEGAEFVVGPLMRNAVTALAARPVLPVPMLALNNLPDDAGAPPGLFQFALSPEDEAITAAERAVADGRMRGIALVPNNDWGRRVLGSFGDTFQRLGGSLLEYRYYEPSDQDYSFEIENLMGLALSVQRFNRLSANLGRGLQFDPRRRGDAEFIFIAAEASSGRLLKSQLKFHYSGDVPVYATSRIYARDGRSNGDLNGVGFADTPWTIAPQPWLSSLPETFAEHWPEQQSLLLERLNAMGFDAYNLVNELHSGGPRAPLDGASGRLSVGEDGRLRRQLPWAEFRGGEPVAMPWPGDEDRMREDGMREDGLSDDYADDPDGSRPRTWTDGTGGR